MLEIRRLEHGLNENPADAERMLVSQIERAKLIAQYGRIANWHHQGDSWYNDGEVDYRSWALRFQDNSNEFLLALIDKQTITNERNGNP